YTFESRTGSCYKFHKVPRTWSRAYMACTAEGGHLAIINSDTEAQVIKELFGKNPAGSMRGNFWKDVAFVGFHDWGEHGEFLTIEGQTLEEAGYAKFSGGEPNNATTGEYCGAVYRSALLDDLWCENKYAFICEMSPDSLLCEDSNEDSQ
ncbi:jg21673, partial [Pararge aegeria aegeria]